MTSFQMAWLHFKRQKLQSALIVISLAMALACSGLLLRVYALSQSRYQSLPSDIDGVLGPKSGGIEILLGALNMETKFHGVIPENLFRTLRAGAELHFEDGSTVSSQNVTRAVIPITFLGQYAGHSVIATDESFFSDSDSKSAPKTDEIWIGYQVAQENGLDVGQPVTIDAKGTISKKTVQKTLRIAKILSEKHNAWDGALFVSQLNTESWLTETEAIHPVWKTKILNYVLFKMNPQGFVPLQSLINDRTVSQLIWVDTEKQKLSDLTNSAKDFGFIIILVIFALAGFSIFGMMSIRAQTLRVSVATLEAMGYLPRYIYSWILFEALMVGVSASVIAVLTEMIGFIFVRSSLGSTWLVSLSQSNSLEWSLLIIAEGFIFSILGAGLSSWQMVGLQIHSELKAG
ncbi:MAG: hypothetical protein H7256_00420 [Bdellovibrio sp.]|nr:hypothetical protein [Bdellovibrio sp.]